MVGLVFNINEALDWHSPAVLAAIMTAHHGDRVAETYMFNNLSLILPNLIINWQFYACKCFSGLRVDEGSPVENM